ncbi:regulator of chromosome condensation (RCC1)-like protein [Phytophthora cinnamomi]|uniref:regulator of chromosome condensation (RCC1)-like protein n=1 Tax=Phytophthora cinnamomi TaxID=4785 RepID=UPI003559C0D7|nr:regulator of chromosome condensation (RCC1)-like protein [Phytophthora cinnamomi]
MADAPPPRLRGTIWKRNAGFLRAWHSRAAVVTADGFLLYKKKADGGKAKEIDLVKATFAATIAQTNGYYCFELQYGPTQIAIGFPKLEEARVWLSGMMEAADENSAGRRAWVANLRRMLTLKLRDRRELVPAMADRDWFSEWNFCLRSLKNDREPITARQRRLKRLHTIWLQFEMFTEILAEIFFSSVQQRDALGIARIESFERAASDYALNGGVDQRAAEFSQSAGAPHPSLLSSMSTSFLSSTTTSNAGNDNDLSAGSAYTKRDDVDEMKLAGVHLEFASKSWQGHKRLAKETALFAKFRSLMELFLSESTAEDGKLPGSLRAVLTKLPSFPLVSAFSIRGVSVVAIAEPLRSERSTLSTIDNRDLAGLSVALREAKMLRYFPYEELPELVVRKFPGNVAPTLVRVHPRYDNVLVNSLRSPMVHGVLIRAVHGVSDDTRRVELLSALDVKELVRNKEPHWIPYLDLVYYQLDNGASPVENLAAKEFLLKTSRYSTSQPLSGDIVVTVDAEKSKLLLDLPEAFVKKYDVDIHPLAMREGGVNVRFLPLVFQYLSSRDQLGVQVLVASEIVARLAKNLFRYRMLNEDTGKTSRWKSRKTRLIKFIDSIMHGLFHKNLPDGQCSIRECFGDQFWDIDGPIMYSLGAFSSSFAMDTKAQKQVVHSSSSCLDKYRDLLKVNPAILFNSLLHVFQARLTKSILPELHENRFVSVPFLRTEDDLTFNYEEDDPKLAMKIHEGLLWSNLQFFRVQFEALKPELPVLNGGEQANNKSKLGVRTELTTWTQYYRMLSQIFRQSLNQPHFTRLEKATQAWQDLTAVRAHLSLALRAAAAPSYHPSGNSKISAVIREHCSFAYLRMASSKALFPIEYKLALRCLELVGSGEELAKAMEECDELLEWLRFFYRPANPSQFSKGSSSHPVYSIQYSSHENELGDQRQEDALFSLREKFKRQQSRKSWMSLSVDYVTAPDMVVLSPQKIRVPTSSGIRGVACGTFTSAVCTNQGHLFLWGSPAAGNGAQLDVDDARVKRICVLAEFEFSQVACGAYHAVAITRRLEYC